MTNPCYKCTDRKAKCHAACNKYIAWQKKSEQWTKSNGQFIPNPLTWINQGRWDNEPMQSAVIDKKTLAAESFDINEFVDIALKRGVNV